MKRRRTGTAALWTLLVIAIVSTMMVATMARFAHARRKADAYANETQCEWLARSGCEIAVAKLRVAADYTGETVSLIPNGEVKITVKREQDKYTVGIEARLPKDSKVACVRTIQRTFHRIADGDSVRLETAK